MNLFDEAQQFKRPPQEENSAGTGTERILANAVAKKGKSNIVVGKSGPISKGDKTDAFRMVLRLDVKLGQFAI